LPKIRNIISFNKEDEACTFDNFTNPEAIKELKKPNKIGGGFGKFSKIYLKTKIWKPDKLKDT
jgi:hypothetical protein